MCLPANRTTAIVVRRDLKLYFQGATFKMLISENANIWKAMTASENVILCLLYKSNISNFIISKTVRTSVKMRAMLL